MRNIILMYLSGTKRRLGYNITGGDLFLTDLPEFPEHIDNLLHARLSILSYLGIDITDKSTELPIGEENRLWAKSFLSENKIDCQRLIAIHPGASVKENRWQPDRFVKVIEYLCLKGYQPVIIEGPIDEYAVNAIVSKCNLPILRVKTGLKNVAALISSCRLIICLDSASMHIAGAVKTPAVVIFGTKWPEVTRPFNDNISVLWDDSFDCRPCKNDSCENTGQSCMDAISAEAVIQEINKRLSILGSG
jgi:ADP-heptose:LPS heptosyltransferase